MMMMYKIKELLDMTMSEEGSMFYNIKLSAISPFFDRVNKQQQYVAACESVNIELENQEPKVETYTITKHLKEIKHFLKHIMKKLKVHNVIKDNEYNNIQYEGNRQYLVALFHKETTKFLLDIHKGEHKIALASLNDMKNGLIHAIQILNGLNIEVLWMDDETLNFFEISFYNFQKQDSKQHILKQGFILKQGGGRSFSTKCGPHVCLTPLSYARKWFILTNQFLCYIERPFPKNISEQGIFQNNLLNVSQQLNGNQISSNILSKQEIKTIKKTQIRIDESLQLREVMLIDHLWHLSVKHSINKSKIKIRTSSRVLSLKYKDKTMFSWRYALANAIDNSPWSAKLPRFVQDSFAPLRKKNKVRILIDGEMYFRNVAEQLRKAESEIFITDWWMVAKYFLERPIRLTDPDDNTTSRLDLLLLAAAERGVKIYIMHWRESRFAVEFNSLITKQYLMSLHPNIKMLRHSYGAIQLWSHHAKLVIIDQQIAFIGGLDICFGRWDTRNHPLYDIGYQETDQCLFPGKDYANERNQAIKNPEDITKSVLERDKDARMPFHDTGVCIEGDTANDLAHHFVQLWNNAKLNKHGIENKTMQVITTKSSKGKESKIQKPKDNLFNRMIRSLRKNRTGSQIKQSAQPVNHPGPEEVKISDQINAISQFDQSNKVLEEDDKFDEGFDEIISKNMNFNQFNLMQNKMKSPASLQQINRRYLSKIQNIFSVLKAKRSNQKIAQQSGISTPKSNKVTNFDDVQIEVNGTEVKPPCQDNASQLRFQKIDFFQPDQKYIAFSQGGIKSIFDEDEQYENKDTTRFENCNGVINNHDFNDSGIIIKRSHIDQTNPIFQNQQFVEEENLELRKALNEVSIIEDSNHNKKTLNQFQLDSQRKLQSYPDQRSPFINSEEVQLLMHTPKKFDTQIKLKPVGDVQQSPDFDKELLVAKRNLIQTFHSYGNIKDDQVDRVLHQNCTIQVLRSASPWSLGLLRVEHSIYEGYIQLIEQSKHFIYIENQFFISQCVLHEGNKQSIVKNKIGLALRERILRAHKAEKPFVVYIFIPLMPAFPGDILESSSSILRLQMNYQMQTMAKGKTSLIELLKSDGIQDPHQYIRFFALRTHSIMPKTGLPKSELIYIHSKCMIVDDTHVIVGSANINDRSMLGSRDHETCVVITQTDPEDLIDVEYAGQKTKASRMAHQFRTELMMEHFGFNYEVVKDPVGNKKRLFDQAQTNSKVFFEIFRCEPDNSIASFVELQTVRQMRKEEQEDKEAFIDKYERLRGQIFGSAVIYPNDFLKDEQLGINFLNSEILVPEIVFV